jgi:glyoxylase-like metal-dependent hydrolase (beta-lactamase superfamily II)
MHPYGLPARDGTGGFFRRGYGVIHCLLVDTGDGLVLVDTGWGVRDCTDPSPAVRQFADLTGCTREVRETAIRQVEALGHDPAEVKHIFMTHLHLDHAGGLRDFPGAIVYASAGEIEASQHPKTLMEWGAYRPEHWAHGPKWHPEATGGGHWFGLRCTTPVRLGLAEFVMIPLPGHTRGHCAVGVRVGDRWLMHCGDAYGYYRQADPVQPYSHPNGRLMEALVTRGFRIPRHHWETLRGLLRTHGQRVRAFCSHDAHEFEMLAEGTEC